MTRKTSGAKVVKIIDQICWAPHDVVDIVIAWFDLRLRGDGVQPAQEFLITFKFLSKVDAHYSLAKIFFFGPIFNLVILKLDK